ncbi:carbohydrate ABC transporter permease [Actinoplanes subtropicus]|uniref:carbohydrate ABC transporter permease n=1 Tax=Actinoplanes subtropicus TaxID=543632 RepID=UPI0004C373BC|nr:sugar ABC transporter permease [Actinoplanes subtropicus]
MSTAPLSHAARKGYLRYLAPGALGFAVVVLVPFVMNIAISFTAWSGIGTPTFTGLDNYQRLIHDEMFWSAFAHSIWFIVAMAIVPTALALVLAAGLFDYLEPRFGPRVSSALRAGFYLPQVLPVAVAGIVWSWILTPYGALNGVLQKVGIADPPNWLGDTSWAMPSVMLVLVWMQLGYGLVIFMAGMARIDPQFHEAAELDGASWLTRFRHVTVPQMRPEIFVVLLTTTIAALKVFGPVFVLTKGGPGDATNVPSYYSYSNFFGNLQVGYGSAIATALTVVVIALTVVFIKIQSKAEGA